MTEDLTRVAGFWTGRSRGLLLVHWICRFEHELVGGGVREMRERRGRMGCIWGMRFRRERQVEGKGAFGKFCWLLVVIFSMVGVCGGVCWWD